MGNYRFRLSDMIPNAWLYKLKDMSAKAKKPHHIAHGSMEYIYNSNRKPANTRKKPTTTSSPAPKPTYHYFSADHPSKDDTKASLTHFLTPPRKSSKKKRRPPTQVSSSSSSSSTSISTSKIVSTSVSAGCSCRATFDPVWKTETLPSRTMVVTDEAQVYYKDNNAHSSWPSSCSCRVAASSSSSTDVSKAKMGKSDGLVDSMPTNKGKKFNCRLDSVLLDDNSNGCYSGKFDDDCDDNNEDCYGATPTVELPPIMTKETKFNDLILDIKRREEGGTPKSKFGYAKIEEKILQSYDHTHASLGTLSAKVVKNQEVKSSPARRSTSSQGLKIRANSPRLASKRIQAYTRRRPAAATNKGVSESFAVVKSSSDPQRDFRDSMVEMIMENNLSASKDLEDLLACYLSLNSNEYHDVIVKVFEQVWFDFTDRPLYIDKDAVYNYVSWFLNMYEYRRDSITTNRDLLIADFGDHVQILQYDPKSNPTTVAGS